MAKTGAEYQRDYRERHSRRMLSLEREVAELRASLSVAETDLDAARDEIAYLSAGGGSRCRRHGKEKACPDCWREDQGGYG
jgi:hypothetical protein